ncbi:MAG: glutamate racemase [Proteobacteria bacterium]|nr:glutamate racemase [Pseudomonadota bacterium]
MNPNKSIGIFDSGVGGLTVCKAVRSLLPHENIIYLGDTARVPYGSRSAQTVVQYAQMVAGHLSRYDLKALVVACNTATTWALELLQKAGSRYNIKVIGVIEPGVKSAVNQNNNGTIGVIGTEGTILGKAYDRALQQHTSAPFVTRSCPLFVPLVEEGWLSGPITESILRHYLDPIIPQINTLILGCTHYPLLLPSLESIYPDITFVDSAQSTALELKKVLVEHNIEKSAQSIGETKYLVTDNLERFANVGYRFLGYHPNPISHINLTADDLRRFLP